VAVVVEAPNEVYSLYTEARKKIFLAGGISNCSDWQSELIKKVQYKNVTLYNPRRVYFPMNDSSEAERQIIWEYRHLKEADGIVFWFSKGSVNPIVLYELGKWGNSSDKKIIVGIDKEYERKEDVIIQTKLSRPDVEIVHSLESIVRWIDEL